MLDLKKNKRKMLFPKKFLRQMKDQKNKNRKMRNFRDGTKIGTKGKQKQEKKNLLSNSI